MDRFKLVVSDIFRGSLHVTKARLPARFYTIRSAARMILLKSGSNAKSLRTNSLVVMRAMVTDLSTTGGRISTIDESTAFPTTALRLYSASAPSP